MKILPWLTLVCLLFLPIVAIAQEQGTADERQACGQPDVNRLCSINSSPIETKIILCLSIKRSENWNPSCRGVIPFLRAAALVCAGDSSRLCGDSGQDRGKSAHLPGAKKLRC